MTLCLVLVSLVAMAQVKQEYVNPKFYKLAQKHEKVAVIPFETQIGLRQKEREKFTEDQIRKMEAEEGISVQNGLTNWFLRKAGKKGMPIEFQDVTTTNALLAKAGITAANMKNYTPQEIAGILGVDAVMGGLFKTSKPMSEGASAALGALVGFWGATNTGDITITLTNAADGTTLWKYGRDLSGGLGSSVDSLIDYIMKKASKKFPYFFMEKYEKDAKK